MVPQREIFWNIAFAEVVYFLGAIAVAALVYAIYRRYRYWRVGEDKKFGDCGRRWWAFIVAIIVDGIINRRFFGVFDNIGRRRLYGSDLKPKEFYPGFIHLLIFVGTVILLIGTALDVISHYIVEFLHGGVYLGFSAATDAGGILAIIGVILALVRRYAQKPSRLDRQPDDLVALLLILIVVVTGFLVEGIRVAATELVTNPDWAPWSPGAYVIAQAFVGMSENALLIWHGVWWWLHSVIAVGAIIYVALYFSRLWHIVIDPVNVFFRNLEPRGALDTIDLETAESFGADRIDKFNWKHLMDLDACTRCGRCQDNCPAHLSGKALSPKKVIQDMKGAMAEEAPRLLKKADETPVRDLLTGVVGEEPIWECTTCYACQQACPVYIEPMAKIIEMRRSLVLEASRFPETLQDALKGLSTRGHPFRGTTFSRVDWCKDLGVKMASEAGADGIEMLYWVGCTSALEERCVRVAAAVAGILQQAGVKFAILGEEEKCCGDPARRAGDEYLYQTMAQANIEVFKAYNIKKVLTSCPHCFNTFKNEYPRFGAEFEVVHHSQLIAELIRQGRLKPGTMNGATVAYHDSCYLGRYNDIYQPPREVIKRISGVKLKELPRRLERGFCCGGGGGHLWMEEPPEKRVNTRRVDEVIATKVTTVATACPYCLVMLSDGIKARNAEETLKVKDISEIILEAGKAT